MPRIPDIFSDLGEYELTVAITGDDVSTDTLHLKFNWTQNWHTAALTLISLGSPISTSGSGVTEKPLSGLRLRKECDKWIESGKLLHERLFQKGWQDEAINDARKWLNDFERFAELNFSEPISDYDRLVYFRTFMKPDAQELAERSRQYRDAIGYCYGNLSLLRNKTK